MQRAMQTLIPFMADLIGVALAFVLLSPLADRLQEMAFFNSVLLGLAFLLFCLAVYALKKLSPAGAAPVEPAGFAGILAHRPLSVLGVFFALVFTVAIAYVVGFLNSVVGVNRFLLDEPAVTIYLLLTPASWFGLSLIYMLLLSGETEQTVQPGSGRYALFSLLGLSGVNLMAVAFTAVGNVFWASFGIPDAVYLAVLLTFLLYLLLFLPPRLLYEAKQPRPWGVVTFLPLLLYLAWLSVP